MRNRYVARSSVRAQRESVNKRILFGAFICAVALIICAVIQTYILTLFGKPPGIVLLLTCAVGMIFGEREGAACGIFGGAVLDALGAGTISLSPMMFMLCGYFCGVCVRFVLSQNLPSFMVYALAVGILRELYYTILCGMMSKDLSLFYLVTDTLLPDLLAFIICAPFAYGMARLMHKIIFINKDRKRKI